MRFLFSALLLLTGMAVASAQTIQQSGAVTLNHSACWVTTGIIKDCGIPAATPYVLTNAPLTLTDGATVTPDLNTGNVFSWTIGAAGRTLANPLNISSAWLGQKLTLYLIQGAGSDTITTWGSVYKFPGGTKPTLSTGAGAIDRVVCEIETTTIFTCTASLNFQ